MMEIMECSQIGISMHFQVVKRTFLKVILKTWPRERYLNPADMTSIYFPINYSSSLQLVTQPANHMNGGFIFCFRQSCGADGQAAINGTWLCLQVMWGRGGGEADAMVVTSRTVLMVARIQA